MNWTQQDFQTLTHFVGFDWAKAKHDVVVVDARGKIVADFTFEHCEQGWQSCREKLKAFAQLAVAIETSQGAAVEKLLEHGHRVFPIHPKAASYYRQRKAPSGNKTNRLDPWSLADALRVDGHTWKPMAAEDPLNQQLRLLSRDEIALIERRTLLVNQLQAALYEYYPLALEAFDDWTQPFTWAFIK